MKTKAAAIVTIRDAQHMSKRGRELVANWLRRHAALLEKYGWNYSGRFTGRYLYKDRLPSKVTMR